MGYRLLTKRLVGADTVMRYEGRTVMSDIDVGRGALADATARVRIGGASLPRRPRSSLGRFPTGQLDISLLIRTPPASLATQQLPQVRADVLGDVARRVYLEASTGPASRIARSAVTGSIVLPAALAAGRRRRASARPRGGCSARPHIAAHRRSSRQATACRRRRSTSEPLVQPVAIPIRDRARHAGRPRARRGPERRRLRRVSPYLTGAADRASTGSTPADRRRPRRTPSLPSSGPITCGRRELPRRVVHRHALPERSARPSTLLSPDAPPPS